MRAALRSSAMNLRAAISLMSTSRDGRVRRIAIIGARLVRRNQLDIVAVLAQQFARFAD
jgi:hypothetical protein